MLAIVKYAANSEVLKTSYSSYVTNLFTTIKFISDFLFLHSAFLVLLK